MGHWREACQRCRHANAPLHFTLQSYLCVAFRWVLAAVALFLSPMAFSVHCKAGDARSAERLEESRNNHYRLRRILEVLMQPWHLRNVFLPDLAVFCGVSSAVAHVSGSAVSAMQCAGDHADGPSHAGRDTRWRVS